MIPDSVTLASFQEALLASQYSGLVYLLPSPIVPGVEVSDDLLGRVTDEVSKEDPFIAARLLTEATRARRAEDANELRHAWGNYVRLIRGGAARGMWPCASRPP